MTKRRLRSLLAVSVCMALTGCSFIPFLSDDSGPAEPTLANLPPARLPAAGQPLPQVGLPQVAENYRAVLGGTEDPALRAQVTQRLADLQMLSGEQNQLAGGVAPGNRYFDATIAAYRDLLRQYPDNPDNDRLLYQLSKAYDLDGRGDESLAVLQQFVAKYPQSRYYAEAQFRRGELLFARAQYQGAEEAYAEVVKAGNASTYYRNALYMQGWAQFKRAGYDAALQSFTATLDLLWPQGAELAALEGPQRELAGDTLRVMSLIFSYQNGAQSIVETYAKLGERHYNAELYRQLGQLYLQQKRYRDAAETYRAYADSRPLDAAAPTMYVLLIAAFEEGNFPSEVLLEKGEFVRRYGIRSEYWAHADAAQREPVRTQLQSYLTELAQHYHALAQRTRATIGKPAAPGTEPIADADKKAAAQKSYRQAGNYYQEYIDTFSNPESEADGVPADPQVVRMVFLLAESRFEAEDFAAAVEAYEQAAYRYAGGDAARGADAGYSALLAYEELIRRAPADARQGLQQAKIASELRFAQRYAADARAVTVQARAADELFAAKDYGAAIAAATVVLQWQPAAEPRLQRSAALIVGHGEFEQQHYAQAEQGYRTAIGFMPAGDSERAAVQERLAAAVYKQGEQRLADGDRQAAAQEFLRVAQVAPDSSIRVNAQYDAAAQFMEGGEWQSAIATLGDLRTRFPQHALSAGVAAKLAVAYQESGQTAAAAAELVRVAKQDSDPATRRDALWAAAELYQKAGANSEASATYRDYVQQNPQPFAQAMEARYQLSVLAAPGEQRRHWLQQIVEADAGAGAQRSERSRFLAAQAQDELAQAQYQAFIATRLTLPLKDSLKSKRAALEQALAAYARSADYGIAQFATKATFRIGEIYAALARDLLQSERPPGLSALEQEQYQILLEEQADPFVEKAIAVHEGNTRRARENIFDEWVVKSYDALAQLQPARYRRPEAISTASDEIR